jgi:hypothetical protein
MVEPQRRGGEFRREANTAAMAGARRGLQASGHPVPATLVVLV